jgi:hypothetical protein
MSLSACSAYGINVVGATEDIFDDAVSNFNSFMKRIEQREGEDKVISLLRARITIKLRIEMQSRKFKGTGPCAYVLGGSAATLNGKLEEIKDKLKSDEVQTRLREDEGLINKLNTPEYSHLIEDSKFSFVQRGNNGKKKGLSKWFSGGSRSTRRRKQKARKSRRKN